MNKEYYIDVFTALGERLARLDEHSDRKIVDAAVVANPWFMSSEVVCAVHNIAENMLSRDVLGRWLGAYAIEYGLPRRVALIMAGNIPLVGLADLMCVLAAGDEAYIKPSSKDTVLINYVVGLLKEIEPSMAIHDYSNGGIYDAVIATGSDNTGKYFHSIFNGIPALIRGSRGSVAVLDGSENNEQLRLLGRDMFLYSGLGCRNVSLLFVPDNYSVERLRQAAQDMSEINPKYCNNYRAMKAKLTATEAEFIDCGNFVVTEGNAFPATLSNIVICRYTCMEQVNAWIDANDLSLQCVASNFYEHPRSVRLGETQSPKLWDYADGIDVMTFLNGIR